MKAPKAMDVKKGISVLWETLQCPICLDLMTSPVSTKCDHQFCKFCMLKLLDNSKQNKANCPVCKAKITKRSLQESPGFQRLVAGLQEMIKAYENDTGTNYFTGIFRQEEQIKITDEALEHQHDMLSRGTPEADHDLPKSLSSTIAAQNGFADLMGFEDTSPLTMENEGLDSGLGEAPPTSDKKMHSSTDIVDTEMVEVIEKTTPHKTKLDEASSHPTLNPDDTKPHTLRKSSRKRHKKDSKPDKILDQKQKRSVEKVAEWLMKVQTEGSLELENLNEDAEDSDSCSSTSTIDVRQHNTDMNPTREEHAKSLEDKVFGAVYRRERKGNRTVPPPLNSFCKLTKTKEKALETISNEKSTSDMEEKQQTIEEKRENSSDIFRDEQMVDDHGEKMPESENNNNNNDNSKDETPRLASDLGQQQPGRKSKKRTRNPVQQVDSDLLEQAQAKSEIPEQKKSNNKRSQNLRSEKGRPAKVTKTLKLVVAVPNEETSPKTRPTSEEVQVHIENYPSSEDQEVPVKRSTRRSRRLQEFTEEVRSGHKKVKLNVGTAKKVTNVSKQSDNTEGALLDKTASPNDKTTTRTPEKNGCVCNEDLGGIENMESGERPEENTKQSNAETLFEAGAAGVPAVPSSSSPAEVTVVDATLGSDHPTSRSSNGAQFEASACETKGAGHEDEEDRNDSELDTEQLVRSFKASKRKSFHLGGGPDVKRSRSSDQDGAQCKKDEEDQCSDVGEPKKQIRTKTAKVSSESSFTDCENLSCKDFISPSISPSRTGKPTGQVAVDVSPPDRSYSGQDSPVGNCVLSGSSPLPPNQTSRCDLDSSCPSVVPKVGESGLYFISVEQDEINIPDSGPDCAMRGEMDERIPACSEKHSAGSAEQIINAESSLTPDGLGTPVGQNSHSAMSRSICSGELSSLSPIKSMGRKRARSQRLQSSSDSSDCMGEEDLPSLTEIFGKPVPAPAATPHEGDSSEENGHEGVNGVHKRLSCSPDIESSQASVDLFGTPDEGDAAVNEPSVSVESSQLSSEVLVTQQKIEMQKELVRLEKLMALVSEVLQEKEASPAKESPPRTDQSNKTTGPETATPLPHDQDTTSEQKSVPEAAQESTKRLPPPTGPRLGSTAELAPCPSHSGPSVKDTRASRTLGSSPAAKTFQSNGSPSEDKENDTPAGDGSRAKMVLVSSGLGPHEQITVKKFAKRVGARVASKVAPETTHVIMHTDDQLVCERTLKYFLGIAGRKWVVSFQWISECFKQKKLLIESPFEVRGDVVNGSSHQGPMRARTTEDSNLLMKDLRICFQGPFTDMTTDEMEWMVELCGAAVVKDPLLPDAKQNSHQLIIIQPGTESSSTHSAFCRRGTVVTRGWLLDSVSTYSLQNYSKYTVDVRRRQPAGPRAAAIISS